MHSEHDRSTHVSGVRMDVHKPTGVAALLIVAVVLTCGGLALFVLRPFVPVFENIAAFLTSVSGWLADNPLAGTILLVCFGILAWAAFDTRAERKREAEREERLAIRRGDTVLPFSTAEIDSGQHAQALHGLIAAEYAAASRQMPNLSSLSYHNRPQVTSAAALPGDVAPSPITVPSFAALMQQGTIGDAQPLMLGYDLATREPLTGDWLDIYSTALAGVPHSGKTTTQRFLACQLALQGTRFVVCDPHMEAGSDSLAGTLAPLQSVYLCDPASDASAILQAVRYVDSIGHRRITGDPDRTRIVLWIDELNGLLDHPDVGNDLVQLLKDTARQYRKVGIYLSCSGHTWTSSSTGGSSDLRANFASRLCHRMERQQARVLLPNHLAAKVDSLEIGQGVLHSMRNSTVIQVPNTTADDVQAVAKRLTDDAPTMPKIRHTTEGVAYAQDMPDVCREYAKDTQAYQASECRGSLSAEALTVWRLIFEEKLSVAEVSERQYGVKSNAGKKYQAKHDHIMHLLRQVAETHGGTTQ